MLSANAAAFLPPLTLENIASDKEPSFIESAKQAGVGVKVWLLDYSYFISGKGVVAVNTAFVLYGRRT